MKQDRVLEEAPLFSAAELARAARVNGAKRTVSEGGARCLAVETPALVHLDVRDRGLERFNRLELSLRLKEVFQGTLVLRLHYSTRAPGMAVDDTSFTVIPFNQPGPWRGPQQLIVPAVNFSPTGFPRGWKQIETIEFDFHSRGECGTVVLGGAG